MGLYVKICISLLFLSVSVFGQFDGGFAFKGPNYGASVDLDGSTEYMSKSSPSNLDLNGSEMITKWSDRNFSSKDSLTWTGAGTHTIDTSSTDKRTGSYSGKLVATAAGDSTTNYVTLPATSFGAIEVGKKYTLEGWVRVATSGTKITAGLGTKWKQSGTLSTTPGTFTKFVYNFQATAAEVNQGIRVYCSQADSLYLDDFSLTQAYDAIISGWIKPNAITTTSGVVIGRLASYATVGPGYSVAVRSNLDGLNLRIGDNNGIIDINANGSVTEDLTATLLNGNWHFYTYVVSRIASCKMYFDGSLKFDNTAVGSISFSVLGNTNNTTAVEMGRNGSSAFYNGYIGHTQIVRFNDVSTETINPAAWYVQGLPSSYANGTIVFEFNPKDGSSDANMLKDYSASGNNLSGTNVTTADRVPANYPIR